MSRLGPVALIALMAAALGLGFVDFGVDPLMPLLALAGVWLALELVVLHVQFGKDLDNAEQITLSEIALGLGVHFLNTSTSGLPRSRRAAPGSTPC